MFSRKNKVFFIILLAIISSVPAFAQNGTPLQRLEVMSQKLETMRRSLSGAASVIQDENKGDKSKKDDKSAANTPLGRLKALEKEASNLQSQVNSLRGKIDRSEKYEISDVDALEADVAAFQSRADTALLETASARANPKSNVGDKREVKKKCKLWFLLCTGNDEYDELIGNIVPGRDRELFIIATREVRKNNYDVGRLLFQTIITTYPDSPYLPMAKLGVADSFYLEGSTSSLIQAAAAYQDWLTFFPTHPLADRVLLKIGESEMRQIGLPDRDATRAKRAEQRLRALLQQYPNSLLRKDVEDRLRQVQDNLGLHNLYIGNFYYKQSVNYQKGGLKGAQSRYREIIDKYPNFSFMDEALFKLAVTYQLEEETDQAARYFQQLVRDYPNSEYVAKAKEQLTLIGATIPTPNPDRMKVMPAEDVSFFQNFRNELFGVYPMTIDRDGVLMTKDFDKCKFELIDKIIENQGDVAFSEIPKTLTAVVVPCEQRAQQKSDTTQQQKQK
jgi:outer membrane protein assembly factor BamD